MRHIAGNQKGGFFTTSKGKYIVNFSDWKFIPQEQEESQAFVIFSLLSMFCEKEGLLCLRNAENGETIMKLSKDGVYSGQSEFVEKYLKAKETMNDDVDRAERIYNFYKAKDSELKNIIG